MPYRPIGSYGAIGDLHSIALVGCDGSIDWFCHPRFDSPSLFGALLDDEKGGRFRVGPEGTEGRQRYLPETNVLVTRFAGADGVAQVTDFMPLAPADRPADEVPHSIIRIAEGLAGRLDFSVECTPRPDYAREQVETESWEGPGGSGVGFRWSSGFVALAGDTEWERHEDRAVSRFSLASGEQVVLRLQGSPPQHRAPDGQELRLLDETVGFWRRWAARGTYRGRWREQVQRSALVLKLMSYRPTGAIIAAPTTSLPEQIGGERNWDYRYSWLRDAGFSVYALLRIGYREEATAFLDWVAEICGGLSDRGLQPVYGVDGRKDLPEQRLDHLEGYHGSRPVRVGNEASDHFQLDPLGAVLDAVYLANKYVYPVSYDLWKKVQEILDWLVDNWDRPDSSIWEMRAERRPYVFSRIMCWVAFERGVRIAHKRGLPADLGKWMKARDAVYEEIMREGWDEERRTFVTAYGMKETDASLLLAPLVFFLSPTDPRMQSTLRAVREDLVVGSLVRRYRNERMEEGLSGSEETFTLCSFWLVEALTRAGRIDEARELFEETLTYASPLGLFSEQITLEGEALGNYPQALTHLALISAAFNLDRALSGRRPGVAPV